MGHPILGPLKEGWDVFFQFNVWLSIASIIMVGVTAITLDVPVNTLGANLFLPAFLVYFIYVRERRYLPEEDRINHPYRTHLVEKYDRPLKWTELASILLFELILLGGLDVLSPEGFMLYLLAHVPVGTLYFYDALKGYPPLDSASVAATWAYLILYSVVVPTGGTANTMMVMVFVGWFAIVLAGVESRNIKDIHGDREAGKDTLASRLGPKPTGILIIALKVTGFLLFAVLGGLMVGGMVISYLVFLRVSRHIVNRTSC